MDFITIIFFAIIYGWIGSYISDFLKEDDGVWRLIVFIAWPAVVILVVLYICLDYIYRRR